MSDESQDRIHMGCNTTSWSSSMAKTSTLKTLPDPSVADELTVIRSRREGLVPQIFEVDTINAFKREGPKAG
jgi:hypothetical protein